jgi:hypothetical protein
VYGTLFQKIKTDTIIINLQTFLTLGYTITTNMKIFGVVLPEGTDTPTNIADEFTPEEVKAIGLSGLPIWVDHRDRSTEDTPYPGVGNIVHDWVDKTDGRKYIVGEIRGSSKEEILTQNRIRHGALKDFSLTHRFELNEHVPTGQLFQTKTPIEVSVCREGRRAKCHILKFVEDSPSSTKTSNLYNDGQSTPFAQPNSFTQKYSSTVMASTGAPSDIRIPNELQLLEEVTALKMREQQMAQQLAQLQQEKQAAAAEAERVKNEQQQQVNKELDSLIDSYLQTNGIQKTEKHQAALEPLRGCKDPAVLTSVKNLVSDMVMANKSHTLKVQELQQQVEQARKGQLVSQYLAASNPQLNKFADPSSRFATTPEINVPATSQTGLFFNPQTGGVTTPVQTPTQQPYYPPQDPNIPFISNWSSPNQYSHGVPNQPWLNRQAMEVKANINHSAPGAIGSHLETFSLDKMAAFHHNTGSDSLAKQDVYGAYSTIGKQIQDNSKNAQQRPF